MTAFVVFLVMPFTDVPVIVLLTAMVVDAILLSIGMLTHWGGICR